MTTDKQLIASLRAQLKAVEAMHREVVKAKDQTIVLLADVVDEQRARLASAPRIGQHVPHDDTPEDWAAAAAQALGKPKPLEPADYGPLYEAGQPHPFSIDDDEDDLAEQLEEGAIDTSEYERALSALQAFNTTIEVQTVPADAD